jgi:transcription antitermination factor NusG
LLIDIKDKNKKWYLLYTKPRYEKKVDAELQLLGFETYLPLNRTLKQWSDRKKWVSEPLFKSYLFINTSISYYYDILNVNGIVKFVNFEKSPVVVNEIEIDFIRKMLGANISVEVLTEGIIEGANIEIISGPMIGIKGQIVEYRSKKQVMVNFNSIKQNLIVNLPLSSLKLLNL